jgi:methyltransferase
VTVFRIDEVVVFDSDPAAENGGARFLVRILEYLETPQCLRRRLFPMHSNLKFVVGVSERCFCVVLTFEGLVGGANCRRVTVGMQGLLPPLDAPHHVRKHEWSVFREGETSLRCFFPAVAS